jgi:hypothetical protein
MLSLNTFTSVPGTILFIFMYTFMYVHIFHYSTSTSSSSSGSSSTSNNNNNNQLANDDNNRNSNNRNSNHNNNPTQEYSLSLHEIVRKCQWKRIITFAFIHPQFMPFIYTIIGTWCCNRHVELLHNTFFYLRYSLLLIITEGAMLVAILYCIQVYGSQSLGAGGGLAILQGIRVMGSSGLIMAWTCYLALTSLFTLHTASPATKESLGLFYIIGLIPVSWYLAPVILLCLTPILLPKEAVLCNGIGFLNGYLLYFGILKILPDFYWTLCFVVNLGAFFCTMSLDPVHNDYFNNNMNENVNPNAVVDYNLNRQGIFIGFRSIQDGDTISVFVPQSVVTTSESNGGGESPTSASRRAAELSRLESGRQHDVIQHGGIDDEDDDEEIKAGDEDFFLGRRQYRPEDEEAVPLLNTTSYQQFHHQQPPGSGSGSSSGSMSNLFRGTNSSSNINNSSSSNSNIVGGVNKLVGTSSSSSSSSAAATSISPSLTANFLSPTKVSTRLPYNPNIQDQNIPPQQTAQATTTLPPQAKKGNTLNGGPEVLKQQQAQMQEELARARAWEQSVADTVKIAQARRRSNNNDSPATGDGSG